MAARTIVRSTFVWAERPRGLVGRISEAPSSRSSGWVSASHSSSSEESIPRTSTPSHSIMSSSSSVRRSCGTVRRIAW